MRDLDLAARRRRPEQLARRRILLRGSGCLSLVTLLLTGCAHVTSRTPASRVFDADKLAISNARGLLSPGQDSYDVVLVDPDLSGDPVAIRRLDAFTVIETDGSRRRRIYVNRESIILIEASRGSDFHVKILAAVILHESRHIEGASETEARRDEAEFFRGLISQGQVAGREGRQYLEILQQRARVPD